MVLIVAIGVYPRPVFDRIRPSVAPIAARLERARLDLPSTVVARTEAEAPSPTPVSLAQDRAR